MKAVLMAMVLPCAAMADVEVRFIEGAPKDRFEIMNISGCDLGPVQIEIDMSESAAGLYFDTSDAGAGVEVFQPFEVAEGAELIAGDVTVRDGETSLKMDLRGLPAETSVAFTIDVDDTLRHGSLGQTQVARSEIAGTSVRVMSGADAALGVIDNTARGVVRVAGCVG